jgi:hypothetical protein
MDENPIRGIVLCAAGSAILWLVAWIAWRRLT